MHAFESQTRMEERSSKGDKSKSGLGEVGDGGLGNAALQKLATHCGLSIARSWFT